MPLNSNGVPTRAPELWKTLREGGEPIEQFFRRVWAPYLPCGLSEADIFRMDGSLYKNIKFYGKRGRPWPADLAMPNNRTKAERSLAMVEAGRWSELTDQEIIQAMRKRIRDREKATNANNCPRRHPSGAGAYPPGQHFDICRDAPTPELQRRIVAFGACPSETVTGGG